MSTSKIKGPKCNKTPFSESLSVAKRPSLHYAQRLRNRFSRGYVAIYFASTHQTSMSCDETDHTCILSTFLNSVSYLQGQ